MHGSAPVHSKITSNPSSSPNAFNTVADVSFARRNDSSGDLARGPAGRQKTSSAKPCDLAKSRRAWLMSMATTRDAPVALATAQARRPIAPAPQTRTRCPALHWARREAWMRTDRGSASAARSKEQSFGSLCEPEDRAPKKQDIDSETAAR